jgi:hypothetical protein
VVLYAIDRRFETDAGVVEATERVLDGRVASPGVLAAGEAFDARDFLRSLEPEHLLVDFSDAAPATVTPATAMTPWT